MREREIHRLEREKYIYKREEERERVKITLF